MHLTASLPTEVVEMRATARRFADEVVAPMVGTEGRDGALERLDGVLERAHAIGLLASPDLEAPGHEYGVWGEASSATGALPSLVMLLEVARACAGVAACLHFAGLGTAALGGTAAGMKRAAVVACPPRWASVPQIGAQGEDSLRVQRGEVPRVDGQARFVWSSPGTDAFVVFAAGDEGLERVLVMAADAGIARDAVAGRMGLAACAAHDLVLSGADGVRLGEAPMVEHITRRWLGLSAISVGNAWGALGRAHAYALERRQGGAAIASHAAVQMLLGEAEARIATSEAALVQLGARLDLRAAAMLHLRTSADCAAAVSDCLQVLGGNGYMEDYRLEKRLRDALTLRSLGGRAADLACRVARTHDGGDK
jgi:alkylation response protein AidB-like acyl-CoA dehydrogenase